MIYNFFSIFSFMSKICFVFSPQNSINKNLFRKYIEDNEVVRNQFEISNKLCQKFKLKSSVLDFVFEKEKTIKKDKSLIQNLSLFTFQVGIFNYLTKVKKVKPNILTSFSFGEYALLYSSGVLDFKSIFEIIILREKTLQKSQKGFLIACFENFKKLEKIKKNICCKSSNNQTLIFSKDKLELKKIQNILKEEKIKYLILKDINYCFHSKNLEKVSNEIKESLDKNLVYNSPKINFFSWVLNKKISKENFDKLLIQKIITDEVKTKINFIKQIKKLSKENKIFIEIGGLSITTNFCLDILNGDKFKCDFFENLIN